MTEAAEGPHPEAAIEEAKRQGFFKGLNFGLLSVAIPSAAFAVGLSLFASPQYESFFRRVKVPMPGLTLLVLSGYPFAATVLVAGILASIIATRVWGCQKRAIYISATLLFASLFWCSLVVTAYHLPFLSIDEGIGPKRTP